MLKKIQAVYCILIGISVIGMWIMILSTGGVTEGPIQIVFHLESEFLMAILLLISGYGLLAKKNFGEKVFLISNGMLVYSVLNAAGYYGQRGDIAMTVMFISFSIISSVLLILELTTKRI